MPRYFIIKLNFISIIYNFFHYLNEKKIHIYDIIYFSLNFNSKFNHRFFLIIYKGVGMIQFIVHDEDDSVGVVTVEGLKANDTLTGWIMDQDVLIDIKINQDIPIGHKLAIKDLNEDDTVIKYGVDIGRTIAKIAVGDHLHVHNVKTKRW